jgi:hypothetical protein
VLVGHGLGVVALQPATHPLDQPRIRVGRVDLPGRGVRRHVRLGWTAEPAAVLHPPARPVGLVVLVGLTLSPQLLLQAALGLLEPLGPPARNRLGLAGPPLIQALLGVAQPPPPPVLRGELLGELVAAEITVDSPDFGHLEPILDAARRELDAAGVSENPEVVLADAGYWHQDQMERIVADGIQVLIPPDSSRRKAPRPGWDGGLYAFMRRVLDTDHGSKLYRQRQQLIEPVFAQTKFNRRLDRFHRRGRAAVRTEWRLISATHNLLKLHKHQLATAAA